MRIFSTYLAVEDSWVDFTFLCDGLNFVRFNDCLLVCVCVCAFPLSWVCNAALRWMAKKRQHILCVHGVGNTRPSPRAAVEKTPKPSVTFSSSLSSFFFSFSQQPLAVTARARVARAPETSHPTRTATTMPPSSLNPPRTAHPPPRPRRPTRPTPRTPWRRRRRPARTTTTPHRCRESATRTRTSRPSTPWNSVVAATAAVPPWPPPPPPPWPVPPRPPWPAIPACKATTTRCRRPPRPPPRWPTRTHGAWRPTISIPTFPSPIWWATSRRTGCPGWCPPWWTGTTTTNRIPGRSSQRTARRTWARTQRSWASWRRGWAAARARADPVMGRAFRATGTRWDITVIKRQDYRNKNEKLFSPGKIYEDGHDPLTLVSHWHWSAIGIGQPLALVSPTSFFRVFFLSLYKEMINFC